MVRRVMESCDRNWNAACRFPPVFTQPLLNTFFTISASTTTPSAGMTSKVSKPHKPHLRH